MAASGKAGPIRAGISTCVGRARRRTPRRLGLESLEARRLLAIFSVTSLADVGAGTFRSAILAANRTPGSDSIDFAVAGTIRVGRGALPAITGTTTVDGSSAPGFAGSPVVTVDFHGTKGLKFAAGADDSALRSLSLVGAGSAGVTLAASRVTVQGNFIGLRADGITASGNRGDGVRVEASSRGDLIGRDDPVTSITYANANSVPTQPVSAWQGIRGTSTPGQYLIAGTSGANGLLFTGSINGVGTSATVNYPGAATTSVYGPDDLRGGNLRLVGSYKTADALDDPVTVHGFLYQGAATDLSTAANYRTIDVPGAKFNYVHSTMGNLAVGNSDGPTADGQPLGPGQAYLYDVAAGKFLTHILYPGSVSDTAYGIWFNGGTSYTICGGYSDLSVNNIDDQGRPIGQGYLVDYDSATGQFSHWTSFLYPHGAVDTSFLTHFEGISSVEKGVYTLSADSVQVGAGGGPEVGSWVSVRRNTDGSFGEATWVDLNPTGSLGLVSSNAVYGNQVVGIAAGSLGIASYQATINVGFQLSNVISGNAGNGIGIYGGSDNQISMNFLGTDASGTVARANGKNGILLTAGASRNRIGGQATGGNDPTAGTFVRPPQGNLISANRGDGVLINGGATGNSLSGNFVGTTASGNASLGNRLDGVAIDHADGNQLIGCTFPQDPFVFYNVISGNGGNGLRIHSSNSTTAQANFLGVGANNGTIVANGGDGLLVSGTSSNTQVGGVIPLGNVISGNARNGIEVADTASGLISFNTFAGIYAFGGAAPNRRDGILITSRGGNNTIRTCIVSGNGGNGIELSGAATGVQVTETAVGTNTSIQTAIPNGGSGIVISGRAHGNAIGGFQPSVEPQVTVSSNRRYGIEVLGSAHDNAIVHAYLGTNFNATADLGNQLGGIYLGRGTSSTVIGGPTAALGVQILNSDGPGVTMQSSSGNAILNDTIANNASCGIVAIGGRNNRIGSPSAGNILSGNGDDGVSLSGDAAGTLVQNNQISTNTSSGVRLLGARRVTIGGASPGSGNRIFTNGGYGLLATGLSTGTLVRGNAIAANAQGNVDVSAARGITYISS